MNIHIPEGLQERFPNIEFRGKVRKYKGRNIIDATNHAVGIKYHYSIDEDFFWFADAEMPEWLLKTDNKPK